MSNASSIRRRGTYRRLMALVGASTLAVSLACVTSVVTSPEPAPLAVVAGSTVSQGANGLLRSPAAKEVRVRAVNPRNTTVAASIRFEISGIRVHLLEMFIPAGGEIMSAFDEADQVAVQFRTASSNGVTSGAPLPGASPVLFSAPFDDLTTVTVTVPDDNGGPGRPVSDCNGNGTADDVDIAVGASADCDANGVPDECQNDSDNDGVIDPCDACPTDRDRDGDGVCDRDDPCPLDNPHDRNGNGICDSNEPGPLVVPEPIIDIIDCNKNGVDDAIDISTRTSKDCNTNGTPDECEILVGSDAPGGPFFCEVDCDPDCNKNGIPDACDGLPVLIGGNGNEQNEPFLARIDPDTGNDTFIDELPTAAVLGSTLPSCCFAITGMALHADGHTLYISTRYPELLVTFDLLSNESALVGEFGSFTEDGTEGQTFQELVISDLAFYQGKLYGSAPQTKELVVIDPGTAEFLSRCSTGDNRLSGLTTSPGGVMYGTTGGQRLPSPGGTLFRIDDPDSCAMTQIGTGTGFSKVAGLAFAPNGRLFGSTASNLELIEIDTITGLGTLRADLDDSSFDGVDGLAFVPALGSGGGDCNDNGTLDACELVGNDCDKNLIPDDCDPDRDGDGIPDGCDLCEGFDDGLDSDGDGVPDDCDNCPNHANPQQNADACHPGDVLCVKQGATGVGDGSSWNDAFPNLQDAILAALNAGGTVKEIWVAAGTYVPDAPGGSRDATFVLLDGVSMYGGFNGTETSRDARDPAANKTVLSGDLNGNDGPAFTNREDNSYHVVSAALVGPTTILDGFTITGGVATEAVVPQVFDPKFVGGGMIMFEASPLVNHCRFVENIAGLGAGGVIAIGGVPTFTNCWFTGNVAADTVSGPGGALFTHMADLTVANCVFTANVAGVGSSVVAFADSAGSASIVNSTFFGNTSDVNGAGGAAVFTDDAVVANCIMWSNVPNHVFGVAFVSSSAIDDGIPGDGTVPFGGAANGNIDLDPLFVDPAGGDATFGTEDDNLRLTPASPCIDAGDNAAVPGGIATDLDGNSRFTDTATPDTGLGTPPIVDMGAYEALIGQDPGK